MAMIRCDAKLKQELERFRRLMVAACKVGASPSKVAADGYRNDTEAGLLRTALEHATTYVREVYANRKGRK